MRIFQFALRQVFFLSLESQCRNSFKSVSFQFRNNSVFEKIKIIKKGINKKPKTFVPIKKKNGNIKNILPV